MSKLQNPLRTANANDHDAISKARWIREAERHILGRKIIGVRYTTDEEVKDLYWDCSVIVLHLDDGSMLVPSADEEGNTAGSLFVQRANGEELEL